jgi:hypothetical protein
MKLREIGGGGVHRIYLAQERNQWQDLVNVVSNLQVLYKVGNFLSS